MDADKARIRVEKIAKLSRTDLFKSPVIQIDKNIVKPIEPANLAKLQTLAAIAVG